MILHLHVLLTNRNGASVQRHLKKWRVLQLMHDRSIFDSLQEVDFMGITPRAANEVAKFRDLIAGFTKMQEYLSVSELVEEVLDKSGYREMLQREKTIESESRLENIEEFLICYEII